MGASLITRQPWGLVLGLPALTNWALGASLALLPGSNKAVGWQCGGMVGWWGAGRSSNSQSEACGLPSVTLLTLTPL